MEIKDILPYIDQYITKRFLFGIYRGRVEYNNDPLSVGRLKVRVPFLHGDKEMTPLEKIMWASPAFPPKSHTVPETGDYVWVTFENGDPLAPVWIGQWYPIHKAPMEYGTATGKADAENKTERKYPTEARQVSVGTYEKKGHTNPPEVQLAQDLDSARERISQRSQKGASVKMSDQDSFEHMAIEDRLGQGMRIESIDATPIPGDRFLESSWETPRASDAGAGRVSLELQGPGHTRFQTDKFPGEAKTRFTKSDIGLEITEDQGRVFIKVPGAILVIDKGSSSLTLVAKALRLACDDIQLACKKLVVSGDIEVNGDMRVSGKVTGIGKDQPSDVR